MRKERWLFIGANVLFVALVFFLASCSPKKAATKPEEVKEGAVSEGEKVVLGTEAEKEAATMEAKKKSAPKYIEGVLLVADFDSGVKPNNVGGDFGAWSKDPVDFTQGCFDSFVSTVRHGDAGYSVQLMYDVASDNPAYNGFWMRLNGADLSAYRKLSFWVKGDELRGYTKVFKIELKNKQNNVGKYYFTDVTGPYCYQERRGDLYRRHSLLEVVTQALIMRLA
ncbi:MAG: hypothetical protein NTZ48_03715 [Candidatus Omnitrophica bacterium]|nr:hypothetical protein [Candidatus Omnitrophota bacterium]